MPGFAARARASSRGEPAARGLAARRRRSLPVSIDERRGAGAALDAARGALRVALASRTRGVLHSGELAVGADAATTASSPSPTSSASRPTRGASCRGSRRRRRRQRRRRGARRRPPSPASRPRRRGGRRRRALAPYPDDGSGLLAGPGHPAFGGGAVDPGAGRFRPRFDPIGPGGPGIPGPFGPGGLAGPRRPRLPGEPDDDHLRVPGRPGDGFGGGDPFI